MEDDLFLSNIKHKKGTNLQLKTTIFCILVGSLASRPLVQTGQTISPDTFTPLLILDT